MSRITPVTGFNHNLADRTPGSYNAYASAATLRTPLYGGLGTVVDEEVARDTRKAVAAAGLDWNISTVDVPLSAKSDKKYVEVVRDGFGPNGDETFHMGIVGHGYKPLQNADLFDFADGLVHGGGYWGVIGHYNYGRNVFGVLKFDNSIFIDPNGANDEVEDTMIIATSHNGSVAVTAAIGALRIRCMNALTVSIRGAKRSWKIRHTTNLEGKMQVAREALNLNRIYMDEFSKMANEMIALEVAKSTVDEIFLKLNPEPEGNARGAHTKWDAKREQFWGIYNGPTLENLEGDNAWKVFNALDEQADWFKAPRKGSSERVLASGAGFIEADNKAKDTMREVTMAVAREHALVRV